MPKPPKKPAARPVKRPAKTAGKKPARTHAGRTAPRAIQVADHLLAALHRAHDGKPWHGPSRAALLADVTLQEACWQPGAGAHSIWETVLHMRSWTREVERRALGGIPGEPVDGDWPAVTDTSEAAWRAALATLDASHSRLLGMIRAMPPERLAARVGTLNVAPVGTGISNAAMLESLADHDIYHSGQLSLLKRLARAALARAALAR